MSHDPVRVAETKAWLKRAESDLRAADYEFGAMPPLLADIVFTVGPSDVSVNHDKYLDEAHFVH